jgi:hypothetical protein
MLCPRRSGENLRFEIQPGVAIAGFCQAWVFDCGWSPRDLNLVFIDAGGDGSPDLDLFRAVLAISPLLFFRVHLVPDAGPSTDWWANLERSGLQAFLGGRYVTYEVAIVVPGMHIAPGPEGSGDPWSEESRRARDANLTESLRNQSWWQRRRMDVFGQPDARVSTDAYFESARDVAEVIARWVVQANPLPRDYAFAVFEAAAKFVDNVRSFGDGIPVKDFFRDLVQQRMLDLEISITDKYQEEALREILQRSSRWLVNPEGQAQDVAERAIAEYRREFDALPAQLRDVAMEEMLERHLKEIQYDLVHRLPAVAKRQRLKWD